MDSGAEDFVVIRIDKIMEIPEGAACRPEIGRVQYRRVGSQPLELRKDGAPVPSSPRKIKDRLFGTYLPIALAAVGCAAAIAIILADTDLSAQRLAWERGRSVREQLIAESSTIDQKLVDRRRDLADIEARLRYVQSAASAAQSELDRALGDRAKAEAERAAFESQFNVVHQQLDEGQKQLLSLKDDLTRKRADVASLNDQQGKFQLAIQQSTLDQTRLQTVVKRLESTIKSLNQLQADLAHDIASRGGDIDHLKQQSENLRKEVGGLDQQRLLLAAQVHDLQGKAANLKSLTEQAAQEEAKVADLRSKIDNLDTQRKEITQIIDALKQQRDDLAMRINVAKNDLDDMARATAQLRELARNRSETRAHEALDEFLNRMLIGWRKASDPLSTPGSSPEAASTAVLAPLDQRLGTLR